MQIFGSTRTKKETKQKVTKHTHTHIHTHIHTHSHSQTKKASTKSPVGNTQWNPIDRGENLVKTQLWPAKSISWDFNCNSPYSVDYRWSLPWSNGLETGFFFSTLSSGFSQPDCCRVDVITIWSWSVKETGRSRASGRRLNVVRSRWPAPTCLPQSSDYELQIKNRKLQE